MIYLEKKMYSNFLDAVVFMIYPGMFIYLYVLFYFAEFVFNKYHQVFSKIY